MVFSPKSTTMHQLFDDGIPIELQRQTSAGRFRLRDVILEALRDTEFIHGVQLVQKSMTLIELEQPKCASNHYGAMVGLCQVY